MSGTVLFLRWNVCVPLTCKVHIFLHPVRIVFLDIVTANVLIYRVVPFVWDKLSGWVEGAQASILR